MNKKISKLEVVSDTKDADIKTVLKEYEGYDEIVVVGIKNGEVNVSSSKAAIDKVLLRLEQARLIIIDSMLSVGE
ncbi:MAG: hypothetical protein QNJ16_19120 [Rhodobacter sp.]|nr:hypothetical protein [Rhodobacter sp.]